MTGIALGAAFLLAATAGWPAAVALLLGATAAVVIRGDRRLLLPALAVATAGVGGAWRRVPPPTVLPPPWADAAVAVRAEVVDRPVVTGRSQRLVLAVAAVRTNDGWSDEKGRLCAIGPPLPEVGTGDQVAATGAVVPIEDLPARLRGFLRQQGCGASLTAYRFDIEAHGGGWQRAVASGSRTISRLLQAGAPGDAGVLLSGLVTGEDQALLSTRRDAFRETNTSHITAVSGANVALLLTIAATLGAAPGWRRRLGWQVLTVVAISGYALLVGAQPPVLRAALVASGALLATRFGRRADCVTLVMLAAALMVAVEPGQLWRLSFQLSVAASLALAAVLPALDPAGWLGWIRALLSATLAAQLATLPLLLSLEGKASLVGIPANLVVGPLVSLAFPLAALAAVAGLVWAPLGEAVVLPALFAAEAVLAIVDGFAASADAVDVGAVPRPLVVGLSAVMAAITTAMSAEGRAWAARLPAAMRAARPRVGAATIGALVGMIVLVLARFWS